MSAGFSQRQLKKLATGLDPARIQTKEQDGKSLSYVEGWFVVHEANRIFGYDGWDREMVHCERLFERKTSEFHLLRLHRARSHPGAGPGRDHRSRGDRNWPGDGTHSWRCA